MLTLLRIDLVFERNRRKDDYNIKSNRNLHNHTLKGVVAQVPLKLDIVKYYLTFHNIIILFFIKLLFFLRMEKKVKLLAFLTVN